MMPRDGSVIETDVLFPSVVIAINAPTEDDLSAAMQRELPVLVLHQGPGTIMAVSDMFFTSELSSPIYI